jgi:hypothetical protein
MAYRLRSANGDFLPVVQMTLRDLEEMIKQAYAFGAVSDDTLMFDFGNQRIFTMDNHTDPVIMFILESARAVRVK